MSTEQLIIRTLQERAYPLIWQAMKDFTEQRTPETVDEIWLVEHDPVYTQGQNGKAEHLLNPTHIPVVQTDRGGQITYHGPGQLVAYILLDLKRQHLTVRGLVRAIEKAIIDFLAAQGVEAQTRCDAPGVYIDKAKVCSLGLRIRRGYSYHGFALNVDMDLSPFSNINPCGFKDLSMTQLKDFALDYTPLSAGHALIPYLCQHLGYNNNLVNFETSKL